MMRVEEHRRIEDAHILVVIIDKIKIVLIFLKPKELSNVGREIILLN